MREEIPLSKLIKIALFTSPLFGILGVAPALAMNKNEPLTIISSFIIVFSIALFLWLINISLLKLFSTFSLFSTKWLYYLLSTVLCITLMLLLLQYFLPAERPRFSKEFIEKFPEKRLAKGKLIMPLIQGLSLNIIVIVLIELVLLKKRKQKIENENARLRLIHLEAKHNQLKQQLQPHFLFNSLSILKSLIKKDQDQAEEYLVRLSDLLRFSIYANKQNLVSLEIELEQSIAYLNMQKVRFPDSLNFNINIPIRMRKTGIVPVYTIQLLVENAIKHNILTNKKPLEININGDLNNNSISVSNNLQPKQTTKNVNGVGLSNLTERYRLLGNYPVDIRKDDKLFVVTIKLINNEHSNY